MQLTHSWRIWLTHFPLLNTRTDFICERRPMPPQSVQFTCRRPEPPQNVHRLDGTWDLGIEAPPCLANVELVDSIL
jgi:hypothetical protein